jgi:hypothetical protein
VLTDPDRKRRKNEALAREIFSSSRKSSLPGTGSRKVLNGSKGSLASRAGVIKVDTSSDGVNFSCD